MSITRNTSAASIVHATPVADDVLVEQVRRGLPDALGALYERYAGRLFPVAYRLTASTPDAEDVLHDLFLGLPELLRKYDHQGQLFDWLRSVTIRLALIGMRKERRRDRFSGTQLEGALVAGPAADPWHAIDLANAVAGLPASLRAVFVLRQIEGYSHDETAALLGLTSGASRVRFLRALRHLRKVLEPAK